jgi:hypothetical protein
MNEDQNFSKRNALNAEKAQLMSSLSANTSPIGDWKVMKIYEARMRGEADPYDFEALATQRQEVRNRLNVISIELAKLDGTEPTPAQLLALAKAEKQTAITEHDNSANVNSFTVGGIPMWLNFDQRSRLKATLDAIEGEGGTEMTKSFGGIDYTFTCVQWRSMINAVEVYAGQCQTVTQEHRNAVDVLTTVEKVQQYDFTTGYPPKLSF